MIKSDASDPRRTSAKKGATKRAGSISGREQSGKQVKASAAVQGKRSAKVALISSKLAYSGPLFDVYTDYVQEPGREVSRRDVVRHSGSVVILAVDASRNADDPMVVVERQYRHAAGQYMWELPAGRKEPEEAPLVGAKRELLEETGYRARRWSKLARIYVSPGFLAEWMQIYLAEDLTAGQTQPDEDEHIECRQVPLSQALQWVKTGKIFDAKSIVALLTYAGRRAGA